ncbi:hypothetical protein MMC13_003003 [Lambiella insularis]|nr:hypothetical protein [Lambiella insularis]
MTSKDNSTVKKALPPKGDGGGSSIEHKITGFQDLASYNWLDEEKPSILVPGVPPIWSPPGVAPHLEPDSGDRYVDQNGDRYPWSPLEPLFLAMEELHPDFEWSDIDVVTDRRPLRKLFGFVTCEKEDFQFSIEVKDKMVIFIRKELSTRDPIPPGEFRGYRQSFEEAYTKLPMSAKGSTSHNRIFRYSLSGVQMVVRSAADAYIERIGIPSGKKKEEADLVNILKAATLGKKGPSVTITPTAPGLKVVRGGDHVPHDAILELKTRFKFAKRPSEMHERMPSLWLSQTVNFVEAWYQNVGTKWSRAQTAQPRLAEFLASDIKMKSMDEELRAWERAHEIEIMEFVTVLRMVIDTAQRMKCPCLLSLDNERDCLTITSADRKTLRWVIPNTGGLRSARQHLPWPSPEARQPQDSE